MSSQRPTAAAPYEQHIRYWEFTAETISILIVELAMLYYGTRKDHRLIDGIIVGLLYPLGLAIVMGLEAAGFD